MIKERIQLTVKRSDDGKSVYGMLDLSHYPVVKTIKVTMDGEEFQPVYFDEFGRPLYNGEYTHIYILKSALKSRGKQCYENMFLDVEYEERKLELSKDDFNTQKGIRKSLQSYETFCNMLYARRIWNHYYTKDGYLDEFVLFEKYLLKDDGSVLLFETKPEHKRDFGELDEMLKEVSTHEYYASTLEKSFKKLPLNLSSSNETCNYCMKKLQIEDIKNGTFGVDEFGRVFHNRCQDEFDALSFETIIMTEMIDPVYGGKTQYDVLEEVVRKVGSEEIKSRFKAFLAHTKDGDILIFFFTPTDEEGYYYVEWQENFKVLPNVAKKLKSVAKYRKAVDEFNRNSKTFCQIVERDEREEIVRDMLYQMKKSV